MELKDYENFYTLAPKIPGIVMYFEMLTKEYGSVEIYRGNVPDTARIEFKRLGGSKTYDVMMGDFAYLCLVSPAVWNVIVKNNFTGTKMISASVKGKEHLEYSLLSVTSKCGPIIDAMSIQIGRPLPMDPTKTEKRWAGLYFDLSTWDGSDFFSHENTCHTIVTKRVVDKMLESKISNISFTPLSECINYTLELKESCHDEVDSRGFPIIKKKGPSLS